MIDPASRAAVSKPRRRNATIALDQRDSPAPTSVICTAFSKSAALMPTRCSAIAVASPPMPPPTISARMAAYRVSGPRVGRWLPGPAQANSRLKVCSKKNKLSILKQLETRPPDECADTRVRVKYSAS
jgi:hypothetical protein